MQKEELKWDITCNRFIAFFDILGFKEMALRNSHEEMLNKLSLIKHFKDNIIEGYDCNQQLKDKGNLKSFLFSDTIIAFTRSDSPIDAEIILSKCNHFIRMCLLNKIPIKGVISFGKITIGWGNTMFFGQPIIDAYLLQEEMQMYGAILDFNAEKKWKEMEIENEKWNKIILYKTPTKNGKINHYCLKWTGDKVIQENIPSANNRLIVEDIYTIVSGKPRIYVDNTLDFLDYLITTENLRL